MRASDVVRAGTVAALVSGAPSTGWALATGANPLAAARAAGTLWPGRRVDPDLARGAVVHLAVSATWTTAVAVAARRMTVTPSKGALAGLGIAALDLGLIAPRRYPAVAALPTVPQVVDHLVFGAVLGGMLRCGGEVSRAAGRRGERGRGGRR